MNEIIAYFSTIPSSHRSLILVGGITFFWLIENAFPLFHFNYKKWQHAGINFFLTFTTILINFTLAFLLLKASDWTIATNFGILQWFANNAFMALYSNWVIVTGFNWSVFGTFN